MNHAEKILLQKFPDTNYNDFWLKYYVQHLVAFVMYSEHSRFSGFPFT